MSKFLKFIVHLVIICTIAGVLALVVPPFMGINTTVIDSLQTQSNLPFGSVTYAKSVPVEALQSGDSIVISEENGVYVYEFVGAGEEGTYSVKDAGNEKTVALRNRTPRVMLTIPYLGFLLVAVQSVEGLIILGLAVLFLIILYIIAELWKKESKKNGEELEEGYEDELAYTSEAAPLKSKKELKQEEKQWAKRMKEEDRKAKEEEKLRKKENKKRKKAIRTGGFVDELTEEDFYEPREAVNRKPAPKAAPPVRRLEEEIKPEASVKSQSTSDMGKTQVLSPLKGEARAEAAVEARMPVQEPAPVQKPEPEAKPEAAPEPVEMKQMAIPIYTAQQLHEKAQAAGDEPEIYRDDESGVTLFDYSKVLSGEDE